MELGYTITDNEERRCEKKRIGWLYPTATHQPDANQLTASSGFQAASQEYFDSEMEVLFLPLFRDMPHMLRPLSELIADYQLDGVFLSEVSRSESYIAEARDTEIPVILWGLPLPAEKPNLGYVSYNSIEGIVQAMEHLVQLGHRRIGFANGSTRAFVNEKRLDGYRLGLSRAGIPYDDSLVFEGRHTFASGAEAFDRLYAQGVTAICCASDKIAVGVIQAAQSAGLNVPEDLSVTGYDNDPVCSSILPGLTTLSQDFFHLGQIAATMMHCLLHGLPMGSVSMIPPMIIRGSTGKAKSAR